MKINRISLLFLVVTLTISSCGGGKKDGETVDSPKEESEEAVLITLKGSDTMVELAQRWAEEYIREQAGDVLIQVTGGGSGTGLASLVNGTTDLATASRSIKDKEIKALKNKGFEVKEYITAQDGLSVYLNQENSIKEMSFPQLDKIFTGKTKNWKELGGMDATIILYGRENSSGTYSFFKKVVLEGKDFVQNISTLPGTASIIQAVSRDPKGIGYGGVGYSSGIQLVKLKKEDIDEAYHPTEENVASGNYPLSRPLFIYTTDIILDQKPEIQDFLDWVLSLEGQKLVTEVGYFPIQSVD